MCIICGTSCKRLAVNHQDYESLNALYYPINQPTSIYIRSPYNTYGYLASLADVYNGGITRLFPWSNMGGQQNVSHDEFGKRVSHSCKYDNYDYCKQCLWVNSLCSAAVLTVMMGIFVKISTRTVRVWFGVGDGGCLSMFSMTFDECRPFDMVYDNSVVII